MGGLFSKLPLGPEQITNSPFTPKELEKLYNRFCQLDKSQRGTITFQDIQLLPELAVNPLADRIAQVFLNNDLVNNEVDFADFVNFLEPFSGNASVFDKLKFAFKVYDVDCDGKISRDDLCVVIKAMAGDSVQDSMILKLAQETMFEVDLDQDDFISFDEFKLSLFDADVEQIMTIKL